MDKVNMKPSALLSPVPVVLVSCADEREENLITIAWAGTICSDPPMVSISVRKERHSYDMIRSSGEFVVNLVTEEMVKVTDFCGVRSGRDVDKFRECGLSKLPAEIVSAPLVAESPMNLECQVKQVIECGSHDVFLAEVVKVHADQALFDEKGRIRLDKAGLVAYCHGEYFGLKRQPLGSFGYSVMKPKTRRRRNRERYQAKHQKSR
jgi:flavin reductase (DIM6/NTAB) family NADH-FMN oxidoreductase RutF